MKYLNKNNLLIVLVVSLYLFLRFKNILGQINFDGEVALNYLEIKNHIVNNTIPLLGPPTGHSFISLGPIFYWFMIIFFKLFGFDPINIFVFYIFLGLATSFMGYYLMKKYFDVKSANYLFILLCLTPFWLVLFRYSRFYLFVVPLTFLYLNYLFKYLKGDNLSLYLSWFVLGIALNFHLTVIALIFSHVLIIYLFKSKKIRIKEILYSALFFIIPNIPFLISSVNNNFEPILKLGLWIPYRFYKFGTVNFNFIAILVLCLALSGLYLLIKNKIKSNLKILMVLFLANLVALLIHGDSPVHYWVAIAPIGFMIISYLFSKVIKSSFLFLWLVILFSLSFYNSKDWLNKSSMYLKQNEISKSIVSQASGNKFNLIRVGEFDYYHGYYAQNYAYLMWLYGNEPSYEDQVLKYTIYEEGDNIYFK
ncbi:MAG: glycosyltransferase family 39 protein [Microgenomates group bacterium]